MDEATDPRVMDEGSREGSKARKKAKKLAEYKVRAFDSATHESGKTAEQVAKYLRARWSVASVSELPDDEFTEAIRWAMGKEDLIKTLETSKKAAQPVTKILDQTNRDEALAGD